MNIDDFAPNFSFFFSNGLDAEYSVIGRVARRIWSIALKNLYGANKRSQMLKYHIQTSGRSLHAQEIDFNDIRTTLQALLAIYGNANSLHTNAYDEAVTTPTEDSVRRAMAIQLIINKELGIAKNENINQGSFIINELTELVEEAVLDEFERIADRGGVLGAMETQYQRGKIQEESLNYETKKSLGQLEIIGVNSFLNPNRENDILEVSELIRSSSSEKELQIKRLNEFKKRNSDLSKQSLSQLQSSILAGSNIFTELMIASQFSSLGQISSTLYNVGGEYRRNLQELIKLNSDFLNDIDNTNFNKIARAITHIENETEQGIEIIQALPYNLEKKQVIGITGSPGSGKSTLINQLIKKYINIGSKIAILAIDPSSPYSGGSLLGDRIRMISDISHPNLYIRSLSSRGQLGGLSTFTYDILRLLQFLKFDKIIIETVGSGQSEIDVSKLSDTTIVTLTPNMGDEIQMIKSGIMEIANIFVINKLDILDVKTLKSKLKNSITLNSETNNTPNIIEISALKDIGIDKLCVAIDEHFNSIKQADILNIKRTNQLKFDLKNKLMKQYSEKLSLAEDQIDSVIKELQENKISLKNALKKLE